jgi:hypothetical protein
MPTVKQQPTYNEAVLRILTWEFPHTDQKSIEAKIKRKLRTAKLGDYDEKRIERLRHLKNEVVAEIEKTRDSAYYSRDVSEFAELSDFDITKMSSEWRKKFSEVSETDMCNFISFAVYIYYLR